MAMGRTITDLQLWALEREAAEAGDMAQVYLCGLALSGDANARARCAEALNVDTQ